MHHRRFSNKSSEMRDLHKVVMHCSKEGFGATRGPRFPGLERELPFLQAVNFKWLTMNIRETFRFWSTESDRETKGNTLVQLGINMAKPFARCTYNPKVKTNSDFSKAGIGKKLNFIILSGVVQPQQPYQPQGYQKEFVQSIESTEQKTQATYQRFQQQQKTEKFGYTNGVYANGHTITEVKKFMLSRFLISRYLLK